MNDSMVSREKRLQLKARMLALGLDDNTLVEKFVLGSGRGGQKINKTAVCVYLRDPSSGIEIKCQAGRSRELNRFMARRELCDRLEERRDGAQAARRQAAEKIRRRKRRRSRRQRQRMLDDKRMHGAKKQLRRPVAAEE